MGRRAGARVELRLADDAHRRRLTASLANGATCNNSAQCQSGFCHPPRARAPPFLQRPRRRSGPSLLHCLLDDSSPASTAARRTRVAQDLLGADNLNQACSPPTATTSRAAWARRRWRSAPALVARRQMHLARRGPLQSNETQGTDEYSCLSQPGRAAMPSANPRHGGQLCQWV